MVQVYYKKVQCSVKVLFLNIVFYHNIISQARFQNERHTEFIQ